MGFSDDRRINEGLQVLAAQGLAGVSSHGESGMMMRSVSAGPTTSRSSSSAHANGPTSSRKSSCSAAGFAFDASDPDAELPAWRIGLLDGRHSHKATAVDPVRGSRLLRGRALEQGEINALFEALDASRPADARDGALLAVLFRCGLRRPEASGITITDVNLDKRTIRIRGKGNRERLAHLGSGTKAAIEAWLGHRGNAQGPLLLAVDRYGRIGRRGLTPGAIRLRLKRRQEAAGIGACSPHDLRRTYVSMLLDAGTDITTVSHMAGHQKVQTTARYDRRGERAARTAAEELHVPRMRGTKGERHNDNGKADEVPNGR